MDLRSYWASMVLTMSTHPYDGQVDHNTREGGVCLSWLHRRLGVFLGRQGFQPRVPCYEGPYTRDVTLSAALENPFPND